MKTRFKKMLVAVAALGLSLAVGCAQACVWNGFACVPVCHVEYSRVWVQTGPFYGQGYWATVANNVCY
jgi:hypothetical protein